MTISVTATFGFPLIVFELFGLFGLFVFSFPFAWTKQEYTKELSALNLSFPSFPLYA